MLQHVLGSPYPCAQVFQFIISDGGDAGKFVLDLKNGSGSAKAGEEGSAVGTSATAVPQT